MLSSTIVMSHLIEELVHLPSVSSVANVPCLGGQVRIAEFVVVGRDHPHLSRRHSSNMSLVSSSSVSVQEEEVR